MTEQYIWDTIEENRIIVEKQKLKKRNLQQGMRIMDNPTPDDIRVTFYNTEIAKCELIIEKHNAIIQELRKLLPADLLDDYDQAVLMVHLQA